MTTTLFDLQTPWHQLAIVHIAISIFIGVIGGMMLLAIIMHVRARCLRHREELENDAAEALEVLFEEWSRSRISMDRDIDRFIAEESNQKLATIIRLNFDK